jgi:metal-responsive CopG/Arc/MetJ family transcriptional regulator
MKTAISIPDTLFNEAEQFAQANGLSRSELFVRAVQLYLDTHRYEGVTAALDAVYAEDPNPLDSTVARAQAHAVATEGW